MIYTGTLSNTRPATVSIEMLPGLMFALFMATNIEEIEQEDGSTAYLFDEAVVIGEPGEVAPTVEAVEENFSDWWERAEADDGGGDDPDEPYSPEELTQAVKDLQEQTAMIEDAVIEMSEKVYK